MLGGEVEAKHIFYTSVFSEQKEQTNTEQRKICLLLHLQLQIHII